MVAALDRQHPRDLFDTKKLLNRMNLTPDLMEGGRGNKVNRVEDVTRP